MLPSLAAAHNVCARGIEAMPRQAVTAPAALVASPAADIHTQVVSSDVQSSEHVNSGLPERPNHGTCLQPNFTFIFHPAAGSTVHQYTGAENRKARLEMSVYRHFQACFPILSTVCLELAATNSSDRRLSVRFKSRLTTVLFT